MENLKLIGNVLIRVVLIGTTVAMAVVAVRNAIVVTAAAILSWGHKVGQDELKVK